MVSSPLGSGGILGVVDVVQGVESLMLGFPLLAWAWAWITASA